LFPLSPSGAIAMSKRPHACSDGADSLVDVLLPLVTSAKVLPKYALDPKESLNSQRLLQARRFLQAMFGVDRKLNFKHTDIKAALAEMCKRRGGFGMGDDQQDEWVGEQAKKLTTMCRHLSKAMRGVPPPKWVNLVLHKEDDVNGDADSAAAASCSASPAAPPSSTKKLCGFDSFSRRAWRIGNDKKKEYTTNIEATGERDDLISADFGDGPVTLPDCTVGEYLAGDEQHKRRGKKGNGGHLWRGHHNKCDVPLTLRRKNDSMQGVVFLLHMQKDNKVPGKQLFQLALGHGPDEAFITRIRDKLVEEICEKFEKGEINEEDLKREKKDSPRKR